LHRNHRRGRKLNCYDKITQSIQNRKDV
jgi:hypothetical protein